MYDMARAGVDVKREPRRVLVSEFTVSRASPDSLSDGALCQNFKYFIRCSKGTYVRSLVHDLVRLRQRAHSALHAPALMWCTETQSKS